ncbi:MAG: radical SAM protein, partial [Proteobacteria bacterium]|nr:radical SAM protein [Pseudomonadota bacterium]
MPRPGPRPPRLAYAILELSLRCNLRCVHCASGSGRPRPAELELESWLEVVRDLRLLGCRAVDLMGGEALLSPLLLPVGEALQRAGLPWGLLTNGWLLDAGRARALTRAGCRGIGVSLDGACAQTHDALRGRSGAFERALAALEVLATLDFKPRNRTVLTSVSRRNLQQLPAMGELLAARCGDLRWQLNLCSAVAPRLPEDLRLDRAGIERVAAFVHDARRRGTYGGLLVSAAHDLGYYLAPEFDLHDHSWEGCPAGRSHVGIQSDGQVKGCLALDASFAVGDVRALGLRAIWEGELLGRHRRFSVEQLGERCRACVWGDRCRGGCTAYSTAHAGQPHDHPHCLWRERSPEARAAAVCSPLPVRGGPGPYLLDAPAPAAALHDEERARSGAPGERYELPLRSACIELTLRCNLSCLHCGSAAGAARRAELDLACFVELFRDLHLLGCERVVLLGGEPLLHPDWQAIARMARGFDLDVALITNGLQVTAATARLLTEIGVTHLGVSIDGASDAV